MYQTWAWNLPLMDFKFVLIFNYLGDGRSSSLPNTVLPLRKYGV